MGHSRVSKGNVQNWVEVHWERNTRFRLNPAVALQTSVYSRPGKSRVITNHFLFALQCCSAFIFNKQKQSLQCIRCTASDCSQCFSLQACTLAATACSCRQGNTAHTNWEHHIAPLR